jgi:hypothetical protein
MNNIQTDFKCMKCKGLLTEHKIYSDGSCCNTCECGVSKTMRLPKNKTRCSLCTLRDDYADNEVKKLIDS